MKTIYDLFNLTTDTDPKVIDKAYKKASLRLHPDKLVHLPPQMQKEKLQEYMELKSAYERWKLDPEGEASQAPAKIEGLVTSPRKPHSHEYKRKHAQFVMQYRQAPLSAINPLQFLTPFVPNLYDEQYTSIGPLANNDNASVDIFTLVRLKSKVYATETTRNSPFTSPLTPSLAVEHFLKFLKGDYYGKQLRFLKQYFLDSIQHLKSSQQYFSEESLYEGIAEILSLGEAETPPGKEVRLLNSLNKITEYAKKTVTISMPVMAKLFQSKFFRQLYAQALHLYWQSSETLLDHEIRKQFSNIEGLEQQINETKDKAFQLKNDEKKSKQELNRSRFFRLLKQLEENLEEDPSIAYSAESLRRKAYFIIDWFYALLPKLPLEVRANLMLQTGIYFQRAAQVETAPELKMADEVLAKTVYQHALSISYEAMPNVALYIWTQILKAFTQFSYRHTYLQALMNEMQEKTLQLADMYPIGETIRSNYSFFKQENVLSIHVLRKYLHTLVEILDTNAFPLDYRPAKVYYEAYEACLKNWYEEEPNPLQETNIKRGLMKILLAEKGWNFDHIRSNLYHPKLLVDRDSEGGITSLHTLSFPLNAAEKLHSIEGVEINTDTGEIKFSFNQAFASNFSRRALLTVADFQEMLRHGVSAAYFSLDPVDPKMRYHPFNNMVFSPSNLEDTGFLQVMFLCDYILKFFTMGQEVLANEPYETRSLHKLIENLPDHLKRIITDYQESHISENIHRFWIEAEEIPLGITEAQNSGIKRYALGEMKMVVKKHRMERDRNGNLVDVDEAEEGWQLYVLNNPYSLPNLSKDERAIIFIEGTNQVHLLENNSLTGPFEVGKYHESIRRVFKWEKEGSGKVKHTIHNAWLKFDLVTKLTDHLGVPHYYSPEYVFAQKMSHHYKEFAQYLEPFARLEEMSRITILVRVLKGNREGNKTLIEKLKKLLNDTTYWAGRKNDVEEAIRKNNAIYSENYNRQYKSLYEVLNQNFGHLLPKLNSNYSRDSVQEVLDNLMKPVSAYSSQITEIIEKRKRDIRAEDYSRWNQYSSEISNELEKQRSAVAEQLNKQIREINRTILRNNFSSLGVSNDDIDQVLNESSNNAINVVNNVAYQLNGMLKQQLVAGLKQTFAQSDSISNHEFNEAAEYHARSIESLAQFFTTKLLTKLSKDIASTNTELSQSIEKERKQLLDRVGVLENLEERFKQLGLAEKEQERDLTSKCTWVPADIVHVEAEKRSRLVYGGVSVQANTNIASGSRGSAMVGSAFFGGQNNQGGSGGDGRGGSGGGGGGIPPSRPHGNSHSYVGPTHVYRIIAPDGTTYKLGESMGRVTQDGRSYRAEQQARALNKQHGTDGYRTEIRDWYENKKDAHGYQPKVIDRFRSLYGPDSLPGNRGRY